MSEYVIADIQRGVAAGSLRAQAYESRDVVEITGQADQKYNLTLALFDGHGGLGQLPRELKTFSDYSEAVRDIAHKTTELTTTGLVVLLHGSFSVANIYGGGGADHFSGAYADGLIYLYGLEGDDTLAAGSSGSSYLLGGAGDDVLAGDGATTVMFGGAGNDRFKGGVGLDTVDYRQLGSNLKVRLGDAGPNAHSVDGRDTLIGIEDVRGTLAHDNRLFGDRADNALTGGGGLNILTGGAGADTLTGGGSEDHLSGRSGDDLLLAGGGAAILAGGTGADVFAFMYLTSGAAHITDYQAKEVIDLSRIDADITSPFDDDAFHLVTKLSGQAGEAQLAHHPQNGYAMLLLDVDGGGVDETIRIDGAPTTGDLIL